MSALPHAQEPEARLFDINAAARYLGGLSPWTVRTFVANGWLHPVKLPSVRRKQIKDFRALWKTACEKAGYPGKILHDFRRTAVRTLERSGVPRSTAMAMVGHKTESIYRRYAIVDEAMHREAAAKMNTYANELKARTDAERTGQVVPFDQQLKNG